MIKLKNVTKDYGSIKALDRVNLEINAGEMALVVGASGAGKSSLMRLLYREEKPDEGQIIIGNIDVSSLSHTKIPYLRRRMGIIFQDFKLLPHKTAFENVAYALRGLGAEEYEIQKRVSGALKLVGLIDRAFNLPSELSGGEQQRVGIARAIVQGPPLVIADEPTGNLDPATSFEIFRLLEKIAERGTTILVSTHNQQIVQEFGKRVITLDKGRVIADTGSVNVPGFSR
ncbi:MAG: cell division ATP-binding protein FtsE [Candidatus Caenarcaniphilales bacterium]|nr:cell division ATP-binding protein FtsE [Candidatus Caenarcaniphilales bacterium]